MDAEQLLGVKQDRRRAKRAAQTESTTTLQIRPTQPARWLSSVRPAEPTAELPGNAYHILLRFETCKPDEQELFTFQFLINKTPNGKEAKRHVQLRWDLLNLVSKTQRF